MTKMSTFKEIINTNMVPKLKGIEGWRKHIKWVFNNFILYQSYLKTGVNFLKFKTPWPATYGDGLYYIGNRKFNEFKIEEKQIITARSESWNNILSIKTVPK